MLIDPAIAQAEETAALVVAHGLAPGTGRTRYCTTGDPVAFTAAVAAITRETNPAIVGLAPALPAREIPPRASRWFRRAMSRD